MGTTEALQQYTETENGIQAYIKLISPKGQNYEARWIGNQITMEKKLGTFDSPRIIGTKVQDLGSKGSQYPLDIYFDAANHRDISKAFWQSVDETGAWSVVHPMLGLKENLYLSRATWMAEPVNNVEYTEFNLNFIQSITEEQSLIAPENEIDVYADQAVESIIEQFTYIVKTDTYSEFGAMVSSINKCLNKIKTTIRKIENLQIIDPRITAIISGIGTTIESFPPDLSQIGAQFSALFGAIGLSQLSSGDAIDNYITFADDLYAEGFDSGVPDTENLNQIAVYEMVTGMTNTELAKATLLPGLKTREDAIVQVNNINEAFLDMVNRLDESQVVFQDTPIEDQFISLSQSFGQQYKLAQKSIEYVLSNTANLLIERRFTILTGRSPLEIAWDELGGPGEYTILEDGLTIDQNYENFCNWNGLVNGQEIWLPAGTEVRVFV